MSGVVVGRGLGGPGVAVVGRQEVLVRVTGWQCNASRQCAADPCHWIVPVCFGRAGQAGQVDGMFTGNLARPTIRIATPASRIFVRP